MLAESESRFRNLIGQSRAGIYVTRDGKRIEIGVLAGLGLLDGRSAAFVLADDIIRQHHERIDGSGYPQRLQGADIPLEARILAVADVMESMAAYRPYRPALGLDAALHEIEAHRGTRYDAAIVDTLLKMIREKATACRCYRLRRPEGKCCTGAS